MMHLFGSTVRWSAINLHIVRYYIFVNFDEIVYIYVCICGFNCTCICNYVYIYNSVHLMNVFLSC